MPAPRQFRIAHVRRAFASLALAAAALATGCATAHHAAQLAPPRMESPAHAADSVRAALGTGSPLEIKFLHFGFSLTEGKQQLAHREYWHDRVSGACRMESTEAGQKRIAIFNSRTRRGMIYEGNNPKPAEHQAEALQEVLGWLASDEFWLLAPQLLETPKVDIQVSGAQMIDNKACPTLLLTRPPGASPEAFQKIWLHLDAATSRPIAWSFARAGQPLPATWLWKEFALVGNSDLPIRFEQVRGKRVINIETAYAPGSINPLVLQKP